MTAPETGKYPASLAESLAVFQANAPRIGKGAEGKIEGESKQTGKKFSYTYKYADLADVSQEVLPSLGAVGLAFTSRPTMQDGEFILAYSLIHVSGDREDGIYPLPKAGSPQQIGSAITYARRYCLCAITGIAPDADDDDAAGAEQEHAQSAATAFEQASRARPRPSNPEKRPTAPSDATPAPRRAERMTQVPADDPWYTAPKPDDRPQVTRPEGAESDTAWLDLIHQQIDRIKTPDDGNKVFVRIVAAHKDKTCTDADRQALEGMLSAKVESVRNQQEATGQAAAA